VHSNDTCRPPFGEPATRKHSAGLPRAVDLQRALSLRSRLGDDDPIRSRIKVSYAARQLQQALEAQAADAGFEIMDAHCVAGLYLFEGIDALVPGSP
jgi:hypothetical protein